jgi:hypothetical protein
MSSVSVARLGWACRKGWVVLAWCFFFGSGAASAQLRTWTNTEGKELQARFVSMDRAAGTVTLRLANGREVTVQASALSPADVAFLDEQPGGGKARAAGLVLSDRRESVLGRGNPEDSDFKTLLLGRVAPAMDLTPAPDLEIFRGVRYLEPRAEAEKKLFGNTVPARTKVLVSTFGFPYASISYHSYDRETVPGFGHTSILTDAADQVVGFQFLNNTPPQLLLWGHHRPDWRCFNFVQNRKKGKSSYQIAHVLQIGGEIVRDEAAPVVPGPGTVPPGFVPPGFPPPGSVPGAAAATPVQPVAAGAETVVITSELIDDAFPPKSREWVLLVLPRKFVGVMMATLE